MTGKQLQEVWSKTSGKLRELLNKDIYDRWIEGIIPLRVEDEVLTLGVSNEIFRDWLSANYQELIAETILELTGQLFKISFEGGHELSPIKVAGPTRPGNRGKVKTAENSVARPNQATAHEAETTSLYNQHFTFNTFVVGDNNRFAYAAASAVAKAPGKAYNPLFIHGATALGKTHLLQAVAHDANSRKKKTRIEYLTSEDFTNHFIDALQRRALPKFRQHLRNLDLLLIDDVQFFTGKEQLQEEFFHTFNTLFNNHRQIIMTSDRPPHEIGGLEKRLVSRFEWGLTTEVMPPNIETRMAILKKKQEDHSIEISDDVLFFIATRIKSNIRRLEGALIQLVSYASISGEPITQSKAADLLRPILEEEGSSALTIETIQRAVAEQYDIRLADMTSKRRPQNIAFPRQIAMYLARAMTSESLPRIAESFNRNHATVLHAVSSIEKKMGMDQEIKNSISRLERKLKIQ